MAKNTTLNTVELGNLQNLVFAVVSGSGLLGRKRAKDYANSLRRDSKEAVAAGNHSDAVRLADQCVDFSFRKFGFEHPFTRSNVKHMVFLKTAG
jgi:hypothetical protein